MTKRDLPEALRHWATQMSPSGLGGGGAYLSPAKAPLLREAAAEIERLRAKLMPFAILYTEFEAAKANEEIIDWAEYVADVRWPSEQDCREASNALEQGATEGK